MNTIILKILCWINGIKNPFVWAAENEYNCNTCIHYKPDNPYCECCFDLDKYESEE